MPSGSAIDTYAGYIMAKYSISSTSSNVTCISTSYNQTTAIDYITFDSPNNPTHHNFSTAYKFSTTGEHVIYIHFNNTLTDLTNLFQNISAVTSINFNNLDITKVTSMTGMCFNCPNLVSVYMSECKPNNLTSMINTFNSCGKLATLDFGTYNSGNFKPQNITTILNCFNYCTAIKTIDMSSFNLSNITSYGQEWAHCYALTKLYLNTAINSNASITTNLFLDSSASGAKLYCNTSKYDYSKIKAVLPSNWALSNYSFT